MADQTSLVSRQRRRQANAKNQPMFRKRSFKDFLIAVSGSFRTGTSNKPHDVTTPPIHINNGQLKGAGPLGENTPQDSVSLSCDWSPSRSSFRGPRWSRFCRCFSAPPSTPQLTSNLLLSNPLLQVNYSFSDAVMRLVYRIFCNTKRLQASVLETARATLPLL